MSKKLCFLLAFIAVSNAKTEFTRLDGRIVGGENAKIEDFPHQISLGYLGSHRCGGAIVSKNIILTAAHCVSGVSAEFLTVRAGSTYKDEGGTVTKVNSIIIHENYSGLDYDIAILKLAKKLRYTKRARRIPLPDENEVPTPNTTCTITGWGALKQGGLSAPTLQKVSVPILDQDECIEAYGSEITPRMICAGLKGIGGKDACQGDSGGPLIANGKLHGIVSWGKGCALAKYPGVYSRVTEMRNWIRTNSGL